MLALFADSLAGFYSMFCYEGDPRKLTKKFFLKNGRRFEMRGKKSKHGYGENVCWLQSQGG